MTEDLHLFDPSEFGAGHRPRVRPVRVEPPIEPLEDNWTYMRDRNGVHPYTHSEAAVLIGGAIVALCGLTGTAISEPGVTVMRRCPACDVASQLQ